ncbi:MAG TPA: AI-2E family transporter, partial [Gemmatimonadales bacterium]|nr:AI-2E family transporter [Gemmatimonadales bacterium]
LVKILIVYAIVNFVDGNITGPRFVGGSVGLHPVVSMLAMALGGTLLGFIGFVLAIPLAVLAKMIILRVMASYKSSGMYGATS